MADDDKRQKRKRKVTPSQRERLRAMREKHGLGEYRGKGRTMRAERGVVAVSDSQVATRRLMTGAEVISIATPVGGISIPFKTPPTPRNPYEAP